MSPDSRGQPPGAPGQDAEDHAEDGQPGELDGSKWARANSRALPTTATGAGDPAEEGAQEQAPEEELLDQWGTDGKEERAPRRAADAVWAAPVSLLGRLAQLMAQSEWSTCSNGRYRSGISSVLAGQADGRAHGQVPPGPIRHP